MCAREYIRRTVLVIPWIFILGTSQAWSVDAPILSAPVNGATGQPVSLTLSWNAVAFADSYRVQLSADSLFRTVSTEQSVPHLAVSLESSAIGPLPSDSLLYWRVRARDNTSTFGNWSTTWHFRTLATRPGTPVLSFPANSGINVFLTDSLKWNADPIADAYRIQLSTSSSFVLAGMVVDTTVPVVWGNPIQSTPLRGTLNKTKYYWRVMSRKGIDTSLWSGSWSFTTIVAAPSAPVLSTPVNAATSQAINPTALTWGAVTDAATYRLQVATDAAFTVLVVNDSTLSGTNKQVSGLLNATLYYWRVNAKNVAATSAYSPVWSFSTKLVTSAAVAPPNNGTNQPIQLPLIWTPSAAASSYRVQVSTSSAFSPYLVNSIVSGDTVMLTGLLNKTKYYWRVSARSDQGDTSAFPAVAWNFTTIVDTPAAPVLLLPAHRSMSQPINPTTLSWNAVTDAANYRLQLSTDSLFAAIASDDSTLASPSKQVNGLLPSTRYFWHVNARNVAATSPYSPTWSFTTRPTVPSVLYPANNSTGQPNVPVLRWTSTPEIVSARVQLSTATGFQPLVIDDTVAVDSVIAGPLANKTKFYWRVSARNANGDTSAFPTTPWNFTTLVGQPGTPTLSAPPMNGVSQTVNPTALAWNASTDAATYRLQVATDSLFASLVVDDSTLGSASKQVAGLLQGMRYFWRVNAKNSAGTSTFSAWRTFTTLLPPPAAISPAIGSTDQPVNPVLHWSRTPNAIQYLVQVAKNTSFKPYLFQFVTANDSGQTGPLGNDTVYYWRVSARNANGDTSSFPATAWSFQTRLASPVQMLPINGANGQLVSPTLSWYAVVGASTYRLQVSDDPGFPGAVIFDDQSITTTSRQVGPLSGSRTYYWRVNARNAAGTTTSDWSAVRNFSTRIDTPSTPTLVSPADGAQDVDFSPTLQWAQANGAAFYTVQMALDPQFVTLVYERTPLITTAYQVGPLIPDTTYYWRVCGINQAASASSPFSAPRSFRTRLDMPSIPAMLSPASRAMAQAVSPVLIWNRGRAAAWYRVQLSTDSYFPSAILDTTIVRDTTLRVGPALQGGNRMQNNNTYFWRVMAGNRLGTSGYSLPYNFTTVIATPALSAPANGAPDQAARNLTFSWAPIAGARTYQFTLASDSGFRTVVARDSLLAGTSTTVDSLAVSTRYFWQVTARSDSNGVTTSSPWSFTTLITVPAVPQLVSPARNTTNTPTTMTFQWAMALGANTYRLQISTDSSFGTVLYDFPALTATSFQVQTLAYSTTYFWRVSAANGNGASAYSPIWRFSVTVPAPATPYLASPLDGAVDVPLPALLSWGQTAGAASFRVRISSVADFSSIAYDTTTALTSVTVAGIAPGAKQYWQVTAQNPGGTRSSSIWAFTTRINAPALPVPAAPLDGAVNTPAIVQLSWTGGAGATGFHLQIARDSLFTLLVLNDSGIVDPSLTVGPLDGFTKFFWRVRAYNTGGSSAFTQSWEFRTVIGTPVLAFPLPGVLHLPNTPTLRWRPVSGNPRYRLQVSVDPAFGTNVLDATALTDTSYRSPALNGFTRYYWRVSAQSLDGASFGDFSAARFFTTVLDTPVVLAPANRALEQPTTNLFAWRKTPFAETYRLEIDTTDSFGMPVFVDSTLVDTTRSVGPLSGMTPFYWHVRAQNPADTGAYNVSRTFQTTIGTPALVSPVNGYKRTPLAVPLIWAAIPGAARYRVQVATDTMMTMLVVDDSLVSAPAYTTPTLDRLRPYYWRVRAKSADGRSIGAYSPVWSFVTVPPPPAATTLLAPADGSMNTSRTVQLRWRFAPGADTYGLQIAVDSLFASVVVNDTTVRDTAYQPAGLQGLQKFYWHVRSINPGGTSVYSARWSFTTIIATPTALLPVQAAPDQPTSVRLVWSSVPRASTYRVQLSVDSLLRSTIVDDSTLVDTARQVSGLARSTVYYWHVRTRAAANVSTSPYSPNQTFVTVIDTPGVPVAVAPLQAARNVSVTPSLTWKPSPRAARYRLQVAADSIFEFVVFEDSTLSDTVRQLPALDHYATYFWRVRASNIGGVSPFSAIRKFQTAMDVPAPSAPPNFASGQPVALTLRWASVAGASKYHLIVAPDSLLRNAIVDDSLITAPSRLVSGLQNLVTYFWRVQARSADNISVSPQSPIWRFTTITDIPASPVLVSPANGSQAIPGSVALSWAPILRADRYHLQIAADSQFAVLVVNDSTLVDTMYVPSSLVPHTQYWWRVQGNNVAGNGPYASAWSFVTLIGTPVLLAPPDSASDLLAPVALHWQSTTGATGYHVQVATDSLFAMCIMNDSSLTLPAADLTVLDPFTKYFWRVRARDARGGGAFCNAKWFVTQLIPPRAPVQTAPLSGLNFAMTTQTFHWRPSRLADRYELQVSLDSPFDSTAYVNTNVTDTLCTVPALQNNTRYYWRVRGVNAKGSGVFSSVWTLTTIVASPLVPELVAPASGSGEHAPFLLFVWRPSAHADFYHLQVSTDAPFQSTLFDDSTLVDTVKKVGPLEYKTTYYWRVRARNSGWVTDWSQVRSVTIMNAPVVYDLFQNYPNPCNPATVIRYDVPATSEISLVLYDLLGQKVMQIVDKAQSPGRYEVEVDLHNLPSGVFIYRLITRPVPGPGQPATDPISFTKKLLILR